MTTEKILFDVLCLINRAKARQTDDTTNLIDYDNLWESLQNVCAKSDKYEEIHHIAVTTDYDSTKSLNDVGEDYGYKESMLEIADVCGVYTENEEPRVKSHDEKQILNQCIGLMHELVGEFENWYRWMHGENAIEELPEEERFAFNMTYFHIIQQLFLWNTMHSGGTSTREKCAELGVDWAENVEFAFEEGDEE